MERMSSSSYHGNNHNNNSSNNNGGSSHSNHSNHSLHSHQNHNNNMSPYCSDNGIKSDSPSRKRRRVSLMPPSQSPPAIWEQRQSPRGQQVRINK